MPRKSCRWLLLIVLVLHVGALKGDDRYHVFDLHGWKIYMSRDFGEDDKEALERFLPLLEGQLDRVQEAVPAGPLEKLRTVRIYVSPVYEGHRAKAEYHPSAEWLSNNGRDPAMAKSVEITSVDTFPFENRRQPSMLLHELAHAYHDQVLGNDHIGVRNRFAQAKRAGIYEKVKRFNGNETVTDRAYALENHKEYFAETTEAFFGTNDFYPFTRDELKEHDPGMFEMLEKLWR